MTRTAAIDVMSDSGVNGGFDVPAAGAAVTGLEANRSLIEIIVCNPSDTDIWLGYGSLPTVTALAETGLRVPTGGAMVLNRFNGAIFARHAGAGSKRLTWVGIK